MQRVSILITGASGDIGQAIYRQLIENEQYDLFLHFRSRSSFERVKIHVKSERTICLFADLKNLDEVERMAAGLPTIDILINNAGFFKAQNFLDTTFQDLQQMLNVNYLAPLILVHTMAKRMARQKSGKIINISSGSGNHGGLLPSFGYAAGKNGINFMGRALEKELAPHNVTMVTVILRFVKTKMYDDYVGYYRSFTGKDLDLSNIDKRVHLNTPEDVASRVVSIVEDDSLVGSQMIEML